MIKTYWFTANVDGGAASSVNVLALELTTFLELAYHPRVLVITVVPV